MTLVKMFESRKAEKLFVELSNSLEGEKHEAFSENIRSLFDKKIISEEGEYNTFRLTEQDVARVFDAVNV
jgi:flagellin-specific chaperone FliS